MHRGLVFDLGNTLVRTLDLIESAYLDVFRAHAISPDKIKLFKQFAGRPKHFLFAAALGDRPDREALVRQCMGEFEARLLGEVARIEEIPGASASLRELGDRGWRIATASGFPRAVGRAVLARFGWDYPVVCDEDVKEHRPAPDPVWKACEHLGVTPPEAIVVGDTPQDLRSAAAAGALSVAVTTGKFTAAELAVHGPTHVLASVAALPALLAAAYPAPGR